MAQVTLYNPRTGQPVTFPSERSAKGYRAKGWQEDRPQPEPEPEPDPEPFGSFLTAHEEEID